MDASSPHILIIGAGPGGCAAALTLAKAGIRCTLVDKAVFPRDKICGDAISGKVVATLDRIDPAIMQGLRHESWQLPSWGITFVAPNGKALKVPFLKQSGPDTPAPGFISTRVDFDHYLLEQVRKREEVDVVEGFEAKEIRRIGDGWEVEGCFDGLAHSSSGLTPSPSPKERGTFFEQYSPSPSELAPGSVSFSKREFAGIGTPSPLERGPGGEVKLPCLPAGRKLQTNLLLLANGAQSRFSRDPGGIHKEPKHYCAGIRTYWEGVEGLDPDGFIELHFLKSVLPGYLWIFPLPGGRANVGIGMRSDKLAQRKTDLKAAILEIVAAHPALKERFATATMTDGPRGFGLPLGSKQRPISGEGYMLLGDAASLIDPFTGEGIGNAVISGKVAAETAIACLQSGDFSREAILAYDREVYRRLWPELRLSHRLQQLVAYPWLFNLVVNKAQRNATLRETISCMFEDLDLRQRLKRPGFYWKLMVG